MGMFDYLRCQAPLPVVPGVDPILAAQFHTMEYQTKDTPNQFMDAYEIREDGTLWVEEYDVEDHSDPKAEGILRIVGAMTRVNQRWTRLHDPKGEIRFYTSLGIHHTGWIEFSALVKGGQLIEPIELVKYEPVDLAEEARRAAESKALWDGFAITDPERPNQDKANGATDPISPST